MLKTDISINWESAQLASKAACDHAAKNGWRICVWVLDRHTNPLAMLRLDGAAQPCTKIAKNKALTAASFGFGTHLWEERLAARPHLLSGLTLQEGFVTFGGGLPILHNGEVIGAIGVSGATEDQDLECAKAGLAALTFE